MKSCKYCKRLFDPWTDYEDCCNCDHGIEEDTIFDGQGPIEYKICGTCKGAEEVVFLEAEFCSAHCRREHYDETQDFN